MGKFFTNLMLKNNIGDKKAFIASFKKSMSNQGLVQSGENDCKYAFALAFNEDGGWVVISSKDYSENEKLAKKHCASLAKDMKTPCICAVLVDSDFAELTLNVGEKSDPAFLGEPYFEKPEPNGDTKLRLNRLNFVQTVQTSELLPQGCSWERFSEILNADRTFAEDGLYEMAELLGIDPKNAVSDYEETECEASEKDVITLYFREKGKRGMSLDSAFKKVFGEALEPLGFQRVKAEKRTHFARVVNGEILQVLTYRQLSSGLTGYKEFEIMVGIISLYRRSIEFLEYPEWWLEPHIFYCRWYLSGSEIDKDFMKDTIQFYCDIHNTSIEEWIHICKSFESAFMRSTSFYCKAGDSIAMIASFQNAFNVINATVLPVLNRVIDLDSCIDYLYGLKSSMKLCDDIEQFKSEGIYSRSDGLAIIKADYRGDNKKYMYKDIAEIKHGMEKGMYRYSQKEFEEKCRQINDSRLKEKVARDRILNDPELKEKMLALAQEYRNANIEKLRGYGIDI